MKATLFRTFCSNMYCGHIWHDFRKSALRKLIVGYNHSFRFLMKFHCSCSASGMFVSNCVPSPCLLWQQCHQYHYNNNIDIPTGVRQSRKVLIVGSALRLALMTSTFFHCRCLLRPLVFHKFAVGIIDPNTNSNGQIAFRRPCCQHYVLHMCHRLGGEI